MTNLSRQCHRMSHSSCPGFVSAKRMDPRLARGGGPFAIRGCGTGRAGRFVYVEPPHVVDHRPGVARNHPQAAGIDVRRDLVPRREPWLYAIHLSRITRRYTLLRTGRLAAHRNRRPS